ncbi:DMT family transporter [Shimia sp. CNT1-13L.2]|uniref:DMT family transporter n=1 Tax=Shimia sp. CNT1-13L.2 TaxID=2959663 RepID=UPI0020CBDAE7|nr:DMT family transporter [Shimia sp. CNT1-13L.2]MCP9483248.1 DMT family transporter [Shimia sp. CNT1-13L.2]
MTEQPNITRASWLMVATLGLVWGSTFLVIEMALEGITPFWLAAGRIGFATLLMVAVWGLRGWKLFATPAPRAWPTVVVVGALSSAIPFMLLSWGQQYVTSGFAGVSMAAVALLVLPLAHFLVPGEHLTLRKGLGFVMGFVGVVVLIGGNAFESTGAALETFGRLACVAAASCYALSSVLVRRLPPVDPIGLATMLLVLGSAIVIPAAWLVEGPPPMPSRETLAILAVLGLIPTAGANLLRVLVIRSAGPTFMSLTNYQVPIWSVVLGALILGEPLPASLLMALALILGGVGLSQYGALTRLFRG